MAKKTTGATTKAAPKTNTPNMPKQQELVKRCKQGDKKACDMLDKQSQPNRTSSPTGTS